MFENDISYVRYLTAVNEELAQVNNIVTNYINSRGTSSRLNGHVLFTILNKESWVNLVELHRSRESWKTEQTTDLLLRKLKCCPKHWKTLETLETQSSQ